MATFVICHGAWSAGWAWKKVRPLITQAGHAIFTPTYSGLGERSAQANPTITLDTHIDDVLAVLFYEDLRDVVLVGHSYGGMVATGVADRAPERISRVVYIDAFVPRNGQSLDDLLSPAARGQREAATTAMGGGWLVPPNPPPPDTSAEDIAWVNPRRGWQPAGTFTQPIALKTDHPALHRSYIYCTRTTPDDRFGPFAARAKSEAGWTYYEIDASHSPNITAPQALVTLLVSIATSKAP